jgi:pentatricopeptide repeat domain-containing protein 1
LRCIQHLEAKGVSVDVVMWGCVITALAVTADWRGALDVIRRMEANQNPAPNVVCYGAAIAACSRAGEWRAALNLLLRMSNGGPKPDVPAYNAVMSACANADEGIMGLKVSSRCTAEPCGLGPYVDVGCCSPQVFHALLESGQRPTEVSYGTAILCCWKAGEWRKAVELLSAMRADGFAPNMITVSLVVRPPFVPQRTLFTSQR